MTEETTDARLRSDARRNRRTVLDAAVALLAQRPQATMQEVADASGLGRTTVYRHFPRRQDLIDALFAEVLREAADTIAEALRTATSARELLCELGPRFIAIGDRYRFIDAHPDLRERALNPAEEIADPLAAYLTKAQERGDIRDDLPVTWILTTLRGLGVVAMVEVNAGRMTVEEAGHRVGETCAAAFTPAPTPSTVS
ncbi:MAG TPA: TetR family transcriptional regulator [Baekduia sp.]|nr:TetR family transcriptional regulator [Baekduia sp.]